MIDQLDRTIDYIRISVTDRCNLRCIYCMPSEGVEWMSHDEILSYEEIVRLCHIFSSLGIKKVKLTGGEPLVRKEIASLIKRLKTDCNMEQVTITTNGLLLPAQIEELVNAGIDGINISLDALDEEKFCEITRKHGVDSVLEGLEKACAYEHLNVKINCVPMGLNDGELVRIAKLAKDKKVNVRFIEMMPIGLGKQLQCPKEEEIVKLLEEEFGPMKPYTKKLGNGPSHYYEVQGFIGKIGFISAISHKFCEECNRVRMTANGYLKACLQYEKGRDLKALLRSGEEDATIREVIKTVIYDKPKCHHFHEEEGEQSLEKHNMSQIGG